MLRMMAVTGSSVTCNRIAGGTRAWLQGAQGLLPLGCNRKPQYPEDAAQGRLAATYFKCLPGCLSVAASRQQFIQYQVLKVTCMQRSPGCKWALRDMVRIGTVAA